MSRHVFHPALARLARDKSVAGLRRLVRRLSSPRRLLLSGLGIVLTVLWLGNAALSITCRQSASPENLRRWIPLGLLAYALWHLVKVAYRRPEEGIEWSAAEREILGGGPFSRGQLLTYRLVTVLTASILKAGCFALLMLPDLTRPVAGFVGALLALLFVELWRMNVEICACGVSRTAYHKLRVTDLACVAAFCISAIIIAFCSPVAVRTGDAPAPLALLLHLGRSAAELEQTWIGWLLAAPFHQFTQVILAQQYSGELLLDVLLALALVTGMAAATYWVDRYFVRTSIRRERFQYDRIPIERAKAESLAALSRRPPALPWQQGWVALAWRQYLGARQYWGSLLIAVSVPTFLALTPLIVYQDAVVTMLGVVGSTAFYSLLLLPAAFRFDFRRDIDHMTLLKSLPISSRATVAGQLVVPVVMASGYQMLVLSTALLLRPVHPAYVAAAWFLLLPTNVLVFALDNLIFLLYPHRPNQEGLEIFLRTTLTFTAKGLLFAVGLAVTAAWALIAGQVAHQVSLGVDPTAVVRVLFPSGMAVMLIVAAAVTMRLSIEAYRRFDPSQDMPA